MTNRNATTHEVTVLTGAHSSQEGGVAIKQLVGELMQLLLNVLMTYIVLPRNVLGYASNHELHCCYWDTAVTGTLLLLGHYCYWDTICPSVNFLL